MRRRKQKSFGFLSSENNKEESSFSEEKEAKRLLFLMLRLDARLANRSGLGLDKSDHRTALRV
jgi:hypothetical protein